MKIEYVNGFPSERSMRILLKRFGFNARMFTFSADYACTRAGILWYKNTLRKDVDRFREFMEWNGIRIKSIRYGSRICSMWFEQVDC